MNEPEKNKKLIRSESLATNTADILREEKKLSAPMTEEAARHLMTKRSRRGFLVGGVLAALGGFGYAWLRRPQNAWIYNRFFAFNEKVSQQFFSQRARAPEFPKSLVGSRVNGSEGLSNGFDEDSWRLQVVGLAEPERFSQFNNKFFYAETTDENAKNFSSAPVSGVMLSMSDIKALPRVEMTIELKCIEGWSIVVNWAGVRFSDFAAKYMPATRNGSRPDVQNRPQDLVRYISLVTPDRGYYVGWDMPSILHQQTLLCYEMNAAPLTLEHGSPLRLVTTTKYGIKQIKRIGRITFTDERPKDYWNERGYDWYSGL